MTYSDTYLLSNLAMESFVTEKLLALVKLSDVKSQLQNNLRILFKHMEHQLGQRFSLTR